MLDQKVIEAVQNGAILRVSLTGVSFPCVNGKEGRQAVLRSLKDKKLPIPAVLVYDNENEYDSNALRIDLADTGIDLGYIPKHGEVELYLRNITRPKRLYRDEVNTLIRMIPDELECNVVSFTGGFNRRVSVGVKIELKLK